MGEDNKVGNNSRDGKTLSSSLPSQVYAISCIRGGTGAIN